MECDLINITTFTCKADLTIYELEYIYNFTKTLFVNGVSTGLTVTINKPSTIKFFNFRSTIDIYSYGVSSFYIEVNYNELYNSSVSIKFGDISITNCEKSKEYNDINCEHQFPESHNGKTLYLIINDQQTNYSITIKSPPIFSFKKLRKNIYFRSSSSQYIYFDVNSSYKMNEKKIVLVPETNNPNINLLSCTFDGYGIQ